MTTKGLQEGAEKSQKEPDVYRCEKCDFFTSKLGNWKRHLKTKKHSCPQMTTDDYKRTTKKEEKGAVANLTSYVNVVKVMPIDKIFTDIKRNVILR